MTYNTKIEWADHTFNPWIGCTKVSPACDHCYAEALMDKRMHKVFWGAGQPRQRTSAANWRQLLAWDKEAARLGIRYRVFCASLADVFDNEVPPEWRQDLMSLIARTLNLDWLLLTKRIGNARKMLSDASMHDAMLLTANDEYQPPANLWLGATICNQDEADRDIPKLLAVPAAKRFLSVEPLLGPVDLGLMCENWLDDIIADPETGARECCRLCDFTGIGNDIDWVIAGGESGSNARPMHPNWVRSLRDQCQAAGVPFLFKQWGEWRPPLVGEEFDTSMGHAAKPPAFILSQEGTVHCFEGSHIINGRAVVRVGKKAAGRLLHGRTWDEFPVCDGGAAITCCAATRRGQAARSAPG